MFISRSSMKRPRGGQAIAFEQNLVDARLGFHGVLLAGDHLAVEKPVDGEAAQKVDELARHVRKHVEPVARRFVVADEPFGRLHGFLAGRRPSEGRRHRSPRGGRSSRLMVAVSLFERRRAAVVLLPEERHARGAEKTENLEQFGGALAFIPAKRTPPRSKTMFFIGTKDTKKSNGAQHKIAHNSVKPSDW